MTTITINIYADPMSQADVERLRTSLRNELSIAEKVMIYCPVPVVDAVAGLATAAIEYAIKGDQADPLGTAWGASKRDWSITTTTKTYVDKVRALDRELINAEVAALDRHIKATAIVSDVARTAGGAIVDGLRNSLSSTLRSKRS